MRPYLAAFRLRGLEMLQYRGAALAGFATQCWWGGIKVMVLAAFYAGARSEPPMTLAEAVTYTWLGQGLLALLPWVADPEVGQAVRTGAVAYDRLRPVDAYAMWFARSTGWTAARVLPRLLLMLLFAAGLLPLLGLHAWAWQPPAGLLAGLAFGVSLGLALLLSVALVMLLNVATVAALSDRGVNGLAVPLVVVFSGNLLPLSLMPDAWQTLLLLQPLAGVLDLPVRLYFGYFTGPQALGILALQLFWIGALVLLGRWTLARTMRRLQVQGG